jgi:hypothetical protein
MTSTKQWALRKSPTVPQEADYEARILSALE